MEHARERLRVRRGIDLTEAELAALEKRVSEVIQRREEADTDWLTPLSRTAADRRKKVQRFLVRFGEDREAPEVEALWDTAGECFRTFLNPSGQYDLEMA